MERKSALMHVTERAETVQGKSVHRFIARSALGDSLTTGTLCFQESR
jgi:hypothetical protein